MIVDLEPGQYVVAVSGGIDSMVLLHVLHGRSDLKLTVAHFDHGIRPDSAQDARLVKQTAQNYHLPYVSTTAHLGQKASEELARQKRYEFLHQVRQASGARAIITAHHQDDLLETAIHNILRGTARRGLTSLRSTASIKRPLLDTTKADIRRYAVEQGLLWREDSTNSDDRYVRNYIRHRLAARIPPADKARMHTILSDLRTLNDEADRLIGDVVHDISDSGQLKRYEFIMLPHAVAREIMAAWLRSRDLREFDSTLIERLVHAAKTYQPGKRIHVARDLQLRVSKEYLALERLER